MKTKIVNHSDASEIFNQDEARVDWHNETLWWVRQKRDKIAFQVPEWENLREVASQIKNNVLSNIHDYLLEFEANAQKNGLIIHWAADAEEHNQLVYSIMKKTQCNADGKIKIYAYRRMSFECFFGKKWG